MQLQKSPDGLNQCLPYSLGMLMGILGEEIIESIGHDGQEIWWPDSPNEWQRHRLFHIQEIIDILLRNDFTLTPIEGLPNSIPAIGEESSARPIWDRTFAAIRFEKIVKNHSGILLTNTHACAWDGEKVFDPTGLMGKLEDYEIDSMWLLGKLI